MSGLIPQSFIDDILYKTDLVELIGHYISLKKSGSSYVACCPFHNEQSPSFNVVTKKQFYHCFGCGASGNAISFLMNYQNVGFIEAIETLASRLGLVVLREGQTEQARSTTDLYALLAKVNLYYQKNLRLNGQTAIAYLKSRGLNGIIAKTYQLGFASEGWHHLEQIFPKQQEALIASGMLIKSEEGSIYDRYRNRIMFPIHDRHGRIIGFGGRVIQAGQKPKYLNSPETPIFQKSRELYGLHQILKQGKKIERIILVEGYMDVIALAQQGITNAVATLGTATSSHHIQLLAKHTKALTFCFDGDAAGKEAAWRGLESTLAYLDLGLEVSFMFLPNGHDPDSLVREKGKEDFLECLEQATPLHHFFFTVLTKEINLSSPGGKTQLMNLCKPYLQKMNESSYKQIIIDDLSRLIHIDSDRIHLLLSTQTSNKAQTVEQTSTITRTPLRIALALLLQHPEIYQKSKDHLHLELLDQEHQGLLIKLLDQLESNPNANTASLIELWRESAHFESMNKLAVWNHQVPEAELIKEFIDTVLFLQKNNQELIIRQLLDKSRQSGLNESEKMKLQDLLKMKHDPTNIEK